MNILQKMANAVVRTLSLRSPDGWSRTGSASDAGESVNDANVMTISSVWACVNLISGTISSLPLMVYRIDGSGNRIVAKDHPLYRILHDSPNYDQTAVDFWDFVAASIELRGNAYAQILRSTTAIIGLVPVNPACMNVRRLSDGSIQYSWTDNGKSYIESDRGVLHIRGFGGDPLGGMSTLHFGRHAFGLARTIDKTAGKMFANGMRPGVTLTFEKWLTDQQRKDIDGKLEEKFVGAVNAGKPFVLEGGQKLQVIDMKPEDAQMLQSRAFSVQEICRFFGVPPFMIGHTEKVTSFGSGLSEQVLGFQKFTLRRRLKRIEQALEKQLLTPVERAAGTTIEFNLDGLLRGDSSARATFYQTMTQIGAMTINEVRALENMPAVPGGDVPRMQMQNVPINESGNLPNVPNN
ncbi:phage portal protein [Rhizobium sp. CNPSo 4062]|uniref:phage portal protein n=1 Tax=Rhizobium sp. CNPSo 4062 TaxID=3021410 RepID=UPI002551420B|nr:phage portal protein [Rhizobium sp. CNPSo 4062]MDK4704321.1 phage portal protein [Rhizobium sp. CNPSo 4062]